VAGGWQPQYTEAERNYCFVPVQLYYRAAECYAGHLGQGVGGK